MRKQITEFIEGRFANLALGPDDDIFVLGFVNSLFAMELVMFLENTYDFSVPNEALRLDHFRTVNSMVELVRRHAPVTAESQPL
jgi:acyl carrier protein